MHWPDFKRGDKVRVKSETHKGRTGVCMADNTETDFGMKHVRILFDDKRNDIENDVIQRTYLLEKVE